MNLAHPKGESARLFIVKYDCDYLFAHIMTMKKIKQGYYESGAEDIYK